jgi:hypothetical protein
MRKYIFLIASTFSVSCLFSQTAPPPADDNTITMKNLQGLLRTQLTITPAWNVTGKSGDKAVSIASGRTNIYLHGTLEYYWTEHFSTRGDAFYFVNKDKSTNGGLKHNHSLQVGASWHLLKSMTFDPFIGATAGISLEQIYPVTMTRGDGASWEYPAPAHLDPIWAPRVGMNFFGQHVFHFFIEAEYLIGMYRPPVGPMRSLNEVRISAGLGLNWVILHKEATVRKGI